MYILFEFTMLNLLHWYKFFIQRLFSKKFESCVFSVFVVSHPELHMFRMLMNELQFQMNSTYFVCFFMLFIWKDLQNQNIFSISTPSVCLSLYVFPLIIHKKGYTINFFLKGRWKRKRRNIKKTISNYKEFEINLAKKKPLLYSFRCLRNIKQTIPIIVLVSSMV